MKHPRTIVGTIAASAALLLVPGTAHADPVLSITSSGNIVSSGSTGTLGQAIRFSGRGCVSPTPGQQTYMGAVAAIGQDPATATDTDSVVFATDSSGNVDADTEIPMDHELGTLEARMFCATTPVPSLTGPDVLWTSALYTLQIADALPAQPPTLMALGRSTVTKSQPSSSVPTVSKLAQLAAAGPPQQATLTVDPDALPLVDRMGIQRLDAASLKQRVDAHADAVAKVQRLYSAFMNRVADHATMAQWVTKIEAGTSTAGLADTLAASPQFLRSWGSTASAPFVTSAYQIVLGRTPTSTEKAKAIASLDSSAVTRAQFVRSLADSPESIARSANFNYVASAYQTLGEATPEVAKVQTYANHLGQGQIKVQVVEDVALTLHNPTWWANTLRTGAA